VTPIGYGRLAEISRDAVRYGQQLGLRDRDVLARRLYDYYRLPISPAWRRQLPNTSAVTTFLRLGARDATRRLLDMSWDTTADAAWLRCRARDAPPDRSRQVKLYLSPLPDALPATVAVVAARFSDLGVPAFKVARTLPGVLRPDKLVAYVECREQALAVAAALAAPLDGLVAHGVPFTAALDQAGLLSWGIDPAYSPRVSWRSWLTGRLAAALISAGDAESGGPREPWEVALYRLALDGVDVQDWEPTLTCAGLSDGSA